VSARSVSGSGLQPPIVTSGALTLTAAHDGRPVTLLPGSALTIDWSKTGNGFICVLLNRSGADLTPTLVGFTSSTVNNLFGMTKLTAGGLTALLVHTPDSGTTKIATAAGDLTT
jgi:hypothetical protein